MRKAFALLLVIIPLMVFTQDGCGPKHAKEKQPFSLNFEMNAESANFLLQNDDINMLVSCTPFYAGARHLPSEKTHEFYDARAKKVDEIIADTDALVQRGKKIKPRVEELRRAYLDYMTVCMNAEPRIEGYAKYTARELLKLQVMEALAESTYDSISYDKIQNPFSKTGMEYMKVQKGTLLGTLYLNDVEDIISFAAIAMESLKDIKNPKIQEAGKELDSAMGGFDGLRGDLKAMIESMLKAQNGFKRLKTGDYYFSRSAVEYMTSQIPGLKEKVKTLRPNAHVSQKDIDFISSYLTFFENVNKSMATYLNSVDTSKLVSASQSSQSTFSAAYADQGMPPAIGQSGNPAGAVTSNYSNAVTAVSGQNQAVVPASGGSSQGWTVKGALSTGWEYGKTAVHGAKSVLGYTIDVAGATVKDITAIGVGIYNGTPWSEIRKDILDNDDAIKDNWAKNMSGSSTLHIAKRYLEETEATGERAGAAATSAVVGGEGWTSWVAGKVAGITVGLFTGFGKGVVTVANRQASTVDYLTGTIDIASAAIGGSKIVLKTTQVPKFLGGLIEGTGLSVKGAGAYATRVFNGARLASLENAATRAFEITGGYEAAAARAAAADALQAALLATCKATRERLTELAKQGAAAGWTNFSGTLRSSLSNFAKQKFTKSLSEMGDAFTRVTGGNLKDVVDTMMGSWVDSQIKDIVDSVMREAPVPEEVRGIWKGTTIFSIVNVPEPKKTNSQGCDIGILQAMKDMKGKALPTYINLSGDPSGHGSATIQLKVQNRPGSPMPLKYTYREDGMIEIFGGDKGVAVKYTGNIQRTENGYTMKGKTTITWGDTRRPFLYLAGDWDASKP